MSISSPPRTEKKFSVTQFAVTIVTTFVSVLFFGKIFLPDKIWSIQFSANLYQYASIFLVLQFLNCVAEWFFHRYMLHAPVVPGFARLYVQHHLKHHIEHTPIVPRSDVWKNRYPIVESSQYEASYFPWYAYIAFLASSMPFAILAQWIWQDKPILIMTIVSVGWSLVVYELWHAIEHLPMSFWSVIFKVFGKFGEKVYSFHQAHHALTGMKLNMAISGFVCGIPLADFVFGTFKLPSVLLTEGARVLEVDKTVPKPLFFICWLDKLAEARIRRYQASRKAALP